MTSPDSRPPRPFAFDHLRHGWLWFGLGMVMVALVVVGSLTSLSNAGGVMLHDKVLHMGAYAALMSWFAQLFRHERTRLLLALGFIVLGIAMEVLQGLVPSRRSDLLDIVANTSGVVLAWALSYTRIGEILPAIERFFGRHLSRV